MRRRVVISGLGPVSPIGHGASAFWAALTSGSTGLAPIERFDASGFPCRLGGEITDLDARQFVPKSYRKATKVMARDIELAVASAKLAADDAGLRTRGFSEESDGFEIAGGRLGCQIGAGLIAAETDELSRALATSVAEDGSWDLSAWGGVSDAGGQGAMNNLPPLWLLKYLPNMLACHVTIVHGCEGPSNTITCAEASAILSIGEGARVIERGDADASFSGGAESKINLMGLLRMHMGGRLTRDPVASDDPREVLRPYDAQSLGGIAGEGGGLAILESADHAKARGVRTYAEVAGFGAAHGKPVVPGVLGEGGVPEVDRGLASAIGRALKDAGVEAGAVDAVFALGAGVPELDRSEAGALREVLGGHAEEVPIALVTPSCGNTMAGHGGLSVAAAAMAVSHGVLPPTQTLAGSASASREADVRSVVVCATGLGGQSGALVLTRAD